MLNKNTLLLNLLFTSSSMAASGVGGNLFSALKSYSNDNKMITLNVDIRKIPKVETGMSSTHVIAEE